ncbi:phosphate-starvation-inducible PsiE family protein [Methylocapsa polymorpha]|uniref:Phosphate-starvation-inducible PsiE family protein n=1 Tax=Methylocapsa polymorpha TaxID=3080828 RepID=A0ABZ0HS02_9HYPH|nr:phosphate-starvation-inducible PsiE family protein [Methylocapsa sp. RX1]
MVNEVGPERNIQEGRRFRLFQETKEAWPRLGLYERFEQAVALVLTVLVSGVILIALAHLVMGEAWDLFSSPPSSLDHTVFQVVFGRIMTVLIALEFNHTILSIFHRKESIVQLRTVILIALLAIVRKFIIMDVTATEPLAVMALGFAVLALGLVYWLVRGLDRCKVDGESSASAG